MEGRDRDAEDSPVVGAPVGAEAELLRLLVCIGCEGRDSVGSSTKFSVNWLGYRDTGSVWELVSCRIAFEVIVEPEMLLWT